MYYRVVVNTHSLKIKLVFRFVLIDPLTPRGGSTFYTKSESYFAFKFVLFWVLKTNSLLSKLLEIHEHKGRRLHQL